MMATPCLAPESKEVEILRRNDSRYRVRRWNAYVEFRMQGKSIEGGFGAFAAEYDAKSDAMTLDDPL